MIRRSPEIRVVERSDQRRLFDCAVTAAAGADGSEGDGGARDRAGAAAEAVGDGVIPNLTGFLAALSFGLGGRDVAGRMLEDAYRKGQEQRGQVERDVRLGKERAEDQLAG